MGRTQILTSVLTPAIGRLLPGSEGAVALGIRVLSDVR